ncbi:MAG: DUF2147 domain-containing protein [Pseudomonadota bacterium]
MRTVILSAAALLVSSTIAFADPIVGNWTTGSGGKVAVSNCGSAFCVKVRSGEHAGKQIGRFNRDGDRYKGKITDPTNDRTYNGSAWFSGTNLKMRGAVLGGLLGRTDTWRKG